MICVCWYTLKKDVKYYKRTFISLVYLKGLQISIKQYICSWELLWIIGSHKYVPLIYIYIINIGWIPGPWLPGARSAEDVSTVNIKTYHPVGISWQDIFDDISTKKVIVGSKMELEIYQKVDIIE